MKNLLKDGAIMLHFGEDVKIKHKPKKFVLGPDRVEIKTKYQLVGKEERVLSPWVDNIIYDEYNKILIFEDSIVLDGNTEDNFAKYENYKEKLKERIQRKVDRKEKLFGEFQTEVIVHLMKKGVK